MIANRTERRLLIDVTDTLAQNFRTGIQRVVRQVLRRIGDIQAADGWDIAPVVAIDGVFHHVQASGIAKLHVEAEGAGHTQQGSGWKAALLRVLEGVPPALDTMQAWNLNRRVRERLASDVGSVVTARPGDVVLLLDTYWGGTSAVTAAGRLRARGAMVVAVIYDLIPLTHSSHTLPVVALTFERRLLRALRLASGAVAISNACATETRAFLERHDFALPIAVFRLGNDPGTALPHSLASANRSSHRYVMVGSIEPHKNHAVVLQAFEALWSEGWNGTLTIVGRVGRGDSELLERLRTHPERGRRITLDHNASDARLAAILAGSDAMIMASKAEGFGLPIVEAFAIGLPVIASDIPVFREVGGRAILPFDPDDPIDLQHTLLRFESNPEAWRLAARDHQWPGWSEAAEELLHAVEAIVQQTLS